MRKPTSWVGATLAWVVMGCGLSPALGQVEKSAPKTEGKPSSDEPGARKASVSPSSAAMLNPTEWLAKKGLTKQGRLFLLDELEAVRKYEEARRLLLSLQKSTMQAVQIEQYDAGLQALNQQAEALKQRVAALQSQLNASSGAGARGRAGQFARQQQSPLRNEQSQTKAMLAQVNAQIQTAKTKAPKADDRKNAPLEVSNARQAYVSAVLDLDTQLAPLLKQYQELGKDQEVIKMIERLEQAEKRAYQLGPSPQITAAARLVIEVKKSLPRSSKPSTSTSTKKSKAGPAKD